MKENFGTLPSGEECSLYTIACGGLTARLTDYGATLVQLLVPDWDGVLADVVLGYDDCMGYYHGNAYFGAVVGRNANRIRGGRFPLGSETVQLTCNNGDNSHHSGPDGYDKRVWQVTEHGERQITFHLESPHRDQGFPGNLKLDVTYSLTPERGLRIEYRGSCDRDTVLNLTNHSYFNLAGHEKQSRAMRQTLCMPARVFLPCDAQSIPTGELRSVVGTPMDFRSPKPLDRDIAVGYEPLQLQKGYDHCFEVFCNPCAILCDPISGRTMTVSTDRPGLQVYSANHTETPGKDGVTYHPRCAVALETQFYPDSVNHPQWPQPVVKAGEPYYSVTEYRFV